MGVFRPERTGSLKGDVSMDLLMMENGFTAEVLSGGIETFDPFKVLFALREVSQAPFVCFGLGASYSKFNSLYP